MCGIVGILGLTPVAPLIVDALKRLEYRGYDSAGIATLEAGHLERLRAEGKLRNLEGRLARAPRRGTAGIGHTRWATHGAPSERNAHPHATERVAVVHNGIIENFRELREELLAAGRQFESETDTEVIAHLVTVEMARGRTPADAVAATLARLRGAFALAFLFEGEEDLLVGARRGSPLAIGYGAGEMFLGSDAIALAPFTDTIAYLEEGDLVVVTRAGATVHDEAGAIVDRPIVTMTGATYVVDKGNHRHFMTKEIHEQPDVVGRTLSHYLDLPNGRARPPEGIDFSAVDRLALTACGTAFYAGSIGRYWFERIARLAVDIDVASEFRYREPPLSPGTLALVISQSGETADTLASLRHVRQAGARVAAVVNVRESTIAREADLVLPTLAGPEIGVASTKAFTAQLAVLAATAVAAGRARGVLPAEEEVKLVRALSEVPRLMTEALRLEPQIETIAREIARVKDVLYLGRGTSYPLALEGALKLKEISYIHAEGYAAGELKHGPIALIDETMPVVVIAPYDGLFEKTVSNMQEVAARGGRIILITDRRGRAAADVGAVETIVMPDMPAAITPLVYAIPVQLLAYHTAVLMGTDVDQPRNLAKSVTVE
ncbi:glutamine--fructose-6-phosphate transaminase (isomerizing) [Prosthecomicrobium pneumaticum]|uniref:Glutamine--fructose-6-phosphate aminotransferase [isomerizing] n=1 Tax=Prosthecomicrobium pneumaticum TaxID=81895 RepID=A0A7W9L308_9HYPH|nr:glutamine--fructose-6-phosphate transaminase (isomerizing) [Prosthecomicrobium pneumaticum]MBB5754057.1 glucosamine--fructose-6-phosphate aminotransferase (isomerizing) [Prosthecomicrobium pneumaticum]